MLGNSGEINSSYLALQYHLGNEVSELINRTALILTSENSSIANSIRELEKLNTTAAFQEAEVEIHGARVDFDAQLVKDKLNDLEETKSLITGIQKN